MSPPVTVHVPVLYNTFSAFDLKYPPDIFNIPALLIPFLEYPPNVDSNVIVVIFIVPVDWLFIMYSPELEFLTVPLTIFVVPLFVIISPLPDESTVTFSIVNVPEFDKYFEPFKLFTE